MMKSFGVIVLFLLAACSTRQQGASLEGRGCKAPEIRAGFEVYGTAKNKKAAKKLVSGKNVFFVDTKPLITSVDIARIQEAVAYSGLSSDQSRKMNRIEIKSESQASIGAASAKLIGTYAVVTFEGHILSWPLVAEPISDGFIFVPSLPVEGRSLVDLLCLKPR